MKKTILVFVAIMVLAIESGNGLTVAEAVKILPAGGSANAACLDYGIEMRDAKTVKSCLLAAPADFTAVDGQPIACSAKYAIAFRPDGKVEYCTVSKDMSFRRNAQNLVLAMAGGRVAFYSSGTLEVVKLRESTQLPYAKNSTVACKAGSQATFRVDGNVSTCFLEQESLFSSGTKKKTASTCQAGGLITFDEFGAFNGCYPPPPVNTAVPTGTTTQGGQTK